MELEQEAEKIAKMLKSDYKELGMSLILSNENRKNLFYKVLLILNDTNKESDYIVGTINNSLFIVNPELDLCFKSVFNINVELDFNKVLDSVLLNKQSIYTNRKI